MTRFADKTLKLKKAFINSNIVIFEFQKLNIYNIKYQFI